jgi:hypothetical protein
MGLRKAVGEFKSVAGVQKYPGGLFKKSKATPSPDELVTTSPAVVGRALGLQSFSQGRPPASCDAVPKQNSVRKLDKDARHDTIAVTQENCLANFYLKRNKLLVGALTLHRPGFRTQEPHKMYFAPLSREDLVPSMSSAYHPADVPVCDMLLYVSDFTHPLLNFFQLLPRNIINKKRHVQPPQHDDVWRKWLYYSALWACLNLLFKLDRLNVKGAAHCTDFLNLPVLRWCDSFGDVMVMLFGPLVHKARETATSQMSKNKLLFRKKSARHKETQRWWSGVVAMFRPSYMHNRTSWAQDSAFEEYMGRLDNMFNKGQEEGRFEPTISDLETLHVLCKTMYLPLEDATGTKQTGALYLPSETIIFEQRGVLGSFEDLSCLSSSAHSDTFVVYRKAEGDEKRPDGGGFGSRSGDGGACLVHIPPPSGVEANRSRSGGKQPGALARQGAGPASGYTFPLRRSQRWCSSTNMKAMFNITLSATKIKNKLRSTLEDAFTEDPIADAIYTFYMLIVDNVLDDTSAVRGTVFKEGCKEEIETIFFQYLYIFVNNNYVLDAFADVCKGYSDLLYIYKTDGEAAVVANITFVILFWIFMTITEGITYVIAKMKSASFIHKVLQSVYTPTDAQPTKSKDQPLAALYAGITRDFVHLQSMETYYNFFVSLYRALFCQKGVRLHLPHMGVSLVLATTKIIDYLNTTRKKILSDLGQVSSAPQGKGSLSESQYRALKNIKSNLLYKRYTETFVSFVTTYTETLEKSGVDKHDIAAILPSIVVKKYKEFE